MPTVRYVTSGAATAQAGSAVLNTRLYSSTARIELSVAATTSARIAAEPGRFLKGWCTDGKRTMPMDAYRDGDQLIVQLDIPGIDPDSLELNVENNVLTVKARRPRPQIEVSQWVYPSGCTAPSRVSYT